jgi:hypothetical protein
MIEIAEIERKIENSRKEIERLCEEYKECIIINGLFKYAGKNF